MGRRGPIPLSAEVLKARGSALKVHRASRNGGGVLSAPPACPEWLSAEARRVWAGAVAAMGPWGVLRPADENALGRYCDMTILHRRLVEARKGLADDDPTAVRLERRALKLCALLLALEEKFGMTPASRARLGFQPATPPESGVGFGFKNLLPERREP